MNFGNYEKFCYPYKSSSDYLKRKKKLTEKKCFFKDQSLRKRESKETRAMSTN